MSKLLYPPPCRLLSLALRRVCAKTATLCRSCTPSTCSLSRFNCQMGRGRTTTGMIVACMIATIAEGDMVKEDEEDHDDEPEEDGIEMHDAQQYLDGE